MVVVDEKGAMLLLVVMHQKNTDGQICNSPAPKGMCGQGFTWDPLLRGKKPTVRQQERVEDKGRKEQEWNGKPIYDSEQQMRNTPTSAQARQD